MGYLDSKPLKVIIGRMVRFKGLELLGQAFEKAMGLLCCTVHFDKGCESREARNQIKVNVGRWKYRTVSVTR